MLKERDAPAGAFGIKEGAAVQEGQSGSFQAMSQDTGEELNGRFTAVYESNLRIETAVYGLQQSYAGTYGCVTEIRDVLSECNDHLARIEAYTATLPAANLLLEKVQRNTENL